MTRIAVVLGESHENKHTNAKASHKYFLRVLFASNPPSFQPLEGPAARTILMILRLLLTLSLSATPKIPYFRRFDLFLSRRGSFNLLDFLCLT